MSSCVPFVPSQLTDFPIQNIPFGVVSHSGSVWIATAYLDCAVDLAHMANNGHFKGTLMEGKEGVFLESTLV